MQQEKTIENIQIYSIGSDKKITNIILLEGDHTNQDIPYFEGMQSVLNSKTLVNLTSQDRQHTEGVSNVNLTEGS